MDFERRPWAAQLYQDNSQNIIVQKCSRVGITEWGMCDMFTLAAAGYAGMYILPDQPLRNRFVSGRFDPVVRSVPEYRDNVRTRAQDKAVDAKGLKTMFGRLWSFVGAQHPRTFYEFDADVMFFDEYDQCPQATMQYTIDRTDASKRAAIRKIGNPTHEDIGINAEFKQGTMFHWFVKCPACNSEQTLTWFDNVIEQTGERQYRLRALPAHEMADIPVVCRGCALPIDRLMPGRWIAVAPNATKSSYQISRIFADVGSDPFPMRVMWNRFNKALSDDSAMQWFYNNLLGLPFVSSNYCITAQMLERCIDLQYSMPKIIDPRMGEVVGGVDIGNQLHVHLSQMRDGRRYKVFIGTVHNYAELARLLDDYKVAICVLDAGPEIHAPREFAANRSGVFLCRYNLDAGRGEQPLMEVNYETRFVRVNRTESLDDSFSQYGKGLVVLPNDSLIVDDTQFVQQMIAPKRIKEQRPDNTFRYIWTKPAADHHRHADNYENIAARMLRGQVQVVVV